jgi:heme-degrading monooxygenase HmoA
MHARLSLIAADPTRLDDVVRYVMEDARPRIEGKLGNLGMAMATDAEKGLAVVESFWVSADAMRESERTVASTREEAARRGGGTVSTEQFRVASQLRTATAGPGAGVRVTRCDIEAGALDAAAAAYDDTVVPWLTETDGFCGTVLLIDRATGRAVVETLWRSRQAMAQSRSTAAAIRADAVAATGGAIRAIEEYVLVFSTAALGAEVPMTSSHR